MYFAVLQKHRAQQAVEREVVCFCSARGKNNLIRVGPYACSYGGSSALKFFLGVYSFFMERAGVAV